MRFIPLLLVPLTSLATAIPLKKGNAWTWRVRDWNIGYTTLRTAVLLDSTPVDSGTSWSLLVRDSVTGKQDTATLLSRWDGSQCWTQTSAWAPWDPTPPRASDLAKMSGQGNYSLFANSKVAWGGAFLAANTGIYFYPTSRSDYADSEARIPGRYGNLQIAFKPPFRDGIPAIFDYSGWQCSGTSRFPAQRWSDSLGFVRGELLPSFDWTLVAFNGIPVAPPIDSLRLPSVGDSMSWSEDSGASTPPVIRSWKILGMTPRIGDAMDVQIEEVVWIAGTRSPAKTIELRLSPDARFISELPIQAQGWVGLISDFPDDSGAGRLLLWSNTSTSGGLVRHSVSKVYRFDLRGTLVEYGLELSQLYETSFPYTSNHTSLTIKLLDKKSLASIDRPVPKSRIRMDLSEIAALNPSLPVRWRDLRGRTGQIPASGFSRGQVGAGLLFLEATLPDGTRWQGSLLATGR